MRPGEVPANFLPRSVGGRVVLGLLSAPAIPFAGVFLYALAVGPGGATPAGRVVRLAMGDLFATLLAVGCCGLVWAVAAPPWLAGPAWRYGRRLTLLALVPFAILVWILVWPAG